MSIKKPKKFKFIDLFAGIGGIRIAFDRAGGNCVFTSEWDGPCQDVYEANFGHRPSGDITKISAKEVPDHDILTGGFPCQAFSIIGERKGFGDTRGTLFFDVERILREKKPKALLLENVRQLTSHDNGRTFKVILEHLGKLGYHIHYKILNGLNYGVPQKRERVMIVGFRKDIPFEFPPSFTKRLSLEDVLEPEAQVPQKFFASKAAVKDVMKRVKKEKIFYPSIWHQNKSGNVGVHEYSCALRANASYNYLLVNGKRRLTPREMLRLQGFPESYKIVVNDSQVRKQAGNCVVIPQIEAVAKAMVVAMETHKIL